MSNSILGSNIKRLRQAKGWTQSRLDSESGTRSTAMFETGQRGNPQYATIEPIARALGVTVPDLFAEPPTVAPPTSERRRKPKPTPRARRRGVVRTKTARVSE